jgi:uncharacterized Zn finger protein (UPF0148 family)
MLPIQNTEEAIKEDKKVTTRRLKFAKSNPKISEITYKSSDKQLIQEKRAAIERINVKISDCQKERNREINRKSKLERLISELISLNREITAGHVICANCGSNRVVFTNDEFTFDVSNLYVRREIQGSIKEEIEIKEEIIDELTRNINNYQELLNLELASTPVSLQTILLFSEEILSYAEIDRNLIEIEKKIEDLNQRLNDSQRTSEEEKLTNKNIISEILVMMNTIYKDLDPKGNLLFDELFTKKGVTYSGSEEQEFYFVKLIALSRALNHKYPIIIDSFRDGELSSEKESFMIKTYFELNKQVILSSTLKREEYSSSRYSEFPYVNAIDYSINDTSHILKDDIDGEFIEILKTFNVEYN